MPRTEASYQHKLVNRIQSIFPGCFILKNDPTEHQGLPDILILFGDRWAMLEVKLSHRANIQPNQVYYIDMFNHMSYASFIFPENELEVLEDLKTIFGG